MINNFNPKTRMLIPELMGNLTPAQSGPSPEFRTAWVSTNVRSTYVVPGDWPDDQEDWFAGDAATYPWRQANNIEYLIDGEATYEAMVEAMETANAPGHFIVIIGWTLHVDDFVLSESGARCPGARKTLLSVLKERVEAGVIVRVLLFPNPVEIPAVSRAKEQLDRLSSESRGSSGAPPIRCILDQNLRPWGAHHQKILLVYGADGLVGFLGGVDFNPDRVMDLKVAYLSDAHGPMHDVHVRIMGEAAGDLMVLATNRWNFATPSQPEAGDDGAQGAGPTGMERVQYYASGKELEDMTPLLERATSSPPPPEPHHIVKLGQTVGNPQLATLQDNGVWHIVRHAIAKAERFIYMEEQYLWSQPAVTLLAKAAAKVKHITILLPPDTSLARERFMALSRMKDEAGADAEKIRIYVIGEEVRQYIHAKIFVVDDELAIIGSANCNDRGYSYDSEVNAAITDQPWASPSGARGGSWWRPELNFARRLRIQLWAEHLRRPAEELIDGVAAEVHWRNRTGQPRVTDYLVAGQLWHLVDYESALQVGIPPVPNSPPDWMVDPKASDY